MEYYQIVCLTVLIIRVVEKGGFKRNICSSISVMRILYILTPLFLTIVDSTLFYLKNKRFPRQSVNTNVSKRTQWRIRITKMAGQILRLVPHFFLLTALWLIKWNNLKKSTRLVRQYICNSWTDKMHFCRNTNQKYMYFYNKTIIDK